MIKPILKLTAIVVALFSSLAVKPATGPPGVTMAAGRATENTKLSQPRVHISFGAIKMTTQKDDLEAVRAVAGALEGFDATEQERIIRWAREKLGLSAAPASAAAFASSATPATSGSAEGSSTSGKDLKTFVAEKKPKSDVQFAAAVAYYYRFEATQAQRKIEINSEDLQEACRLASRQRFKNPGQTLRNAHTLGLLDKGSQSGYFTINSVGENLVAMTLPGDGEDRVVSKSRTIKKGTRKKRAARTTKK